MNFWCRLFGHRWCRCAGVYTEAGHCERRGCTATPPEAV